MNKNKINPVHTKTDIFTFSDVPNMYRFVLIMSSEHGALSGMCISTYSQHHLSTFCTLEGTQSALDWQPKHVDQSLMRPTTT